MIILSGWGALPEPGGWCVGEVLTLQDLGSLIT
jgi:hypothetical protein